MHELFVWVLRVEVANEQPKMPVKHMVCVHYNRNPLSGSPQGAALPLSVNYGLAIPAILGTPALMLTIAGPSRLVLHFEIIPRIPRLVDSGKARNPPTPLFIFRCL